CALVLGTGHGARSVVLGLMDGGWKVKIWNRNAARARMLRALFARYGEQDRKVEEQRFQLKNSINQLEQAIHNNVGEKETQFEFTMPEK
ncbi:MAG: hypothetical protein RI930_171, partial [Pseudomonadota bacterium]